MRVERLSKTITLYCGDNREILPTLGFVDAMVTDPPYGIGVDRDMHEKGKLGKKYGAAQVGKREYAETDWDSAPPPAELFDQLRAMSRYQIIFGGNYFALPPSRCWLVWDKKVNGQFADCELAWTNLDKPVRRIEWMWNGMLRKGQEARGLHPTQKPLGVMRWCLGHLPPDAKTICDPFMGSGTTGVACVREGKRFVGIEREEGYFEAACQRIAEAIDRPDMLIAPEPQARQEALFAAE